MYLSIYLYKHIRSTRVERENEHLRTEGMLVIYFNSIDRDEDVPTMCTCATAEYREKTSTCAIEGCWLYTLTRCGVNTSTGHTRTQPQRTTDWKG